MAQFNQVFVQRSNRQLRLRAVWERNGVFYAQIRVPGQANQTKVRLLDEKGEPVSSPAEAEKSLARLRDLRDKGELPVLRKTPTLAEWSDKYLSDLEMRAADEERSEGGVRQKHPKTIALEKCKLGFWTRHFGHLRLADISADTIDQYFKVRVKKNPTLSPRSLNLDVIVLNNCLRSAVQAKLIRRLPSEGRTPLKVISARRPLWSTQEIQAVCAAAKRVGKNGEQFADYVWFMAMTGARRNEALAVRWEDVDWTRRQVWLCKTKFGHPRFISFTSQIETLLKKMEASRAANGDTGKKSPWLFPSPGCGGETVRLTEHVKCFQGSLITARTEAARATGNEKLLGFGFHDLRHYFISECVMAGIPYMTIAQWAGHKDGGVLIGRVYGHLNAAHLVEAADHLGEVAFRGPKAPKAPAPVPATPAPAIDAGALLAQLQQQSALIAQLIAAQQAKA